MHLAWSESREREPLMRTRLLMAMAMALTLLACGGMESSSVSQGTSLTQPDGSSAAAADGGTFMCDCEGMALPAICTTCGDGTTACAHFVCAQGMCEIQLCQ